MHMQVVQFILGVQYIYFHNYPTNHSRYFSFYVVQLLYNCEQIFISRLKYIEVYLLSVLLGIFLPFTYISDLPPNKSDDVIT